MDELDKYILDNTDENIHLKIYEILYTYLNRFNESYTQYVQVIASNEDKAINAFKNKNKRNIVQYRISRVLNIYDGLVL